MKKASLFFALILVFTLFAGCTGKHNGTKPPITETTLVNIGNPMRKYIPDSEESWQRARSVWDMQVHNGKLYIGSGDFNSNSGSKYLDGAYVLSYDIASEEWKREYTASTEQIDRLIPARGNLYIPSCDSTKGTSVAFSCINEKWKTDGNIPYAVHIFDLFFDEEQKTIFAGIGCEYGNDPFVGVSVDEMKSFSYAYFRKDGTILKGNALSMGNASSRDQVSRTYNLLTYNGEIYATLYFTVNANVSSDDKKLYDACNGLYRYNAAENVFDFVCNCPELLSRNFATHSSDVVFQNRVVAASGRMAASTTQDLTEWEYIEGFTGPVTDLRVIGDCLYFTTYFADAAGNCTNRLYRTSDLQNFEELYAFDYSCYVGSFTYANGTFYLGTECALKSPDVGDVFRLVLADPNCTHPHPAEDGSCPNCGNSK